ncbi:MULTISPECIES: hypothetical protein [Pseudoalteromonas]|uniref:hypothetical protein n=1 Tax=Pseudoalteromonas TaxID=53246 RepID=UPI000C34610C|nr:MULTISPECIES: hypothetical protein [Pseudoalteromonas]PKG65840.1 hypothetical protein CXF75_06755 [Pseudoalteromonas arctica]PKG72402.1 hypothetical protein CXF64_00790 [Pseudoalteromonas sp. GutCa3]
MEPNYSEYSITELQEAITSIDRALYPERFERLKAELLNRDEEEHDASQLVSLSSKDLLIKLSNAFFVIPLMIYIGIDALNSGEILLKGGAISKNENFILFTLSVIFCFLISAVLTCSLFVDKSKSS